ncbi:MAG: hypothetical protein PHW53_01945 [Patescibacteria group bacterium]|nr:hypothetical protein [Patescibacteria group bacterium]
MPKKEKAKSIKIVAEAKPAAKPRPKKRILKVRKAASEKLAPLAEVANFPVESGEAGRAELDRLIVQEAVKDQPVFSMGEETKPEESIFNTIEEPAEFEPDEDGTIFVSPGEPVSLYRRVLLWSSVSLCAAVIGFGWILTIGGSLGLKSQSSAAEYEPMTMEEINREVNSNLEDIKAAVDEDAAKAMIEDNTLEKIIEEVKNSSSTGEVATGERDIFSPPSSTTE